MIVAPTVSRTSAPVFRTKELGKVYRSGDVEVHALRGVDFEARRGEFIVILGPSGSGKSTFLNIIGGLDSASSGEAWFEDLDALSPRPCRVHLPVL
jgi:putative ABC transport system ATP-binding protein